MPSFSTERMVSEPTFLLPGTPIPVDPVEISIKPFEWKSTTDGLTAVLELIKTSKTLREISSMSEFVEDDFDVDMAAVKMFAEAIEANASIEEIHVNIVLVGGSKTREKLLGALAFLRAVPSTTHLLFGGTCNLVDMKAGGDNSVDLEEAFFSLLNSMPSLVGLTLSTGQYTGYDDPYSRLPLEALSFNDIRSVAFPHNFFYLKSFLSNTKSLQSLEIYIRTNANAFLRDLADGLRNNSSVKCLYIHYKNQRQLLVRNCRLDFSLLKPALADHTGKSLSIVEHLGIDLGCSPNPSSVKSVANLLGSSRCQLESTSIQCGGASRDAFISSYQGLLSVLRSIQGGPPVLKSMKLICNFVGERIEGEFSDTLISKNLASILPRLKHLTSLNIIDTGLDFKVTVPNDQKAVFLKEMAEHPTSFETLQVTALRNPWLTAALNQLCVRNKATKAVPKLPYNALPWMLEAVKKPVDEQGPFFTDHQDGCIAQVLYSHLRAHPAIVDKKARTAPLVNSESGKGSTKEAINDDDE